MMRLRGENEKLTLGNMEERSDSMPSFSVWASMSLFSERKEGLLMSVGFYSLCCQLMLDSPLEFKIFTDLTNNPLKGSEKCSQTFTLEAEFKGWLNTFCNIINHIQIHNYHGSPWFSAKTVRRQSPASAELASATNQHHEMKSEATGKSPELQRDYIKNRICSWKFPFDDQMYQCIVLHAQLT